MRVVQCVQLVESVHRKVRLQEGHSQQRKEGERQLSCVVKRPSSRFYRELFGLLEKEKDTGRLRINWSSFVDQYRTIYEACKKGLTRAVRALLAHDPSTAVWCSSDEFTGLTPLCAASANDQTDVICIILSYFRGYAERECGLECTIHENDGPNVHIECIANADYTLTYKRSTLYTNAMSVACRKGCVNAARALLAVSDHYSFFFIKRLVERKTKLSFERWWSMGDSLHEFSDCQNTALYGTGSEDGWEVVYDGVEHPLYIACAEGHDKIVELLTADPRIDVNAVNTFCVDSIYCIILAVFRYDMGGFFSSLSNDGDVNKEEGKEDESQVDSSSSRPRSNNDRKKKKDRSNHKTRSSETTKKPDNRLDEHEKKGRKRIKTRKSTRHLASDMKKHVNKSFSEGKEKVHGFLKERQEKAKEDKKKEREATADEFKRLAQFSKERREREKSLKESRGDYDAGARLLSRGVNTKEREHGRAMRDKAEEDVAKKQKEMEELDREFVRAAKERKKYRRKQRG